MGRIIWHHFLRIMIISHSECPFNVLLMPCERPLAAASVPPLLSALFEVPNSAVNDTFVTAALWFGSIRGQTLEWQLGQKTGRNRNWCDDYLWTSRECEEEGMTGNRLIRSRRLKTVVSRARLSRWYQYDWRCVRSLLQLTGEMVFKTIHY